MKTFLLRSLLAFVSGVALALSFPPYQLSLLMWFAFIPLLYAIRGCRSGEVLIYALIQQLSFCGLSGSWVFSTLHLYTHLPLATSAIEFALLCVMLASFGTCAIAAAEFISETVSIPLTFTLPIVWVAGEWLRVRLPFSFPWNLLGYAAYRDIHLIQFAEFTGVYGISALIMFVNVSVYELLFESSAGGARRRVLATLIAIPSIAMLFGTIRAAQIAGTPAAGRLRVALISGGLPSAEVHTVTSRAETFDLYRENTQLTLREHPDLVIWPESSAMCIFQPTANYPLTMAEDSSYRRSLVRLANDANTPILFGALAFRQKHGKVTMFNRAYLLSRRGAVDAYYDKIKLVPFGEYLPMQQFLEGRVRTITSVRDLASGHNDSLFNVAGAKLGVRICYESVFPDLMRRAVAAGADILVNISNDAWYGKIGAEQALAMTAMRAVENKRPVVRVANQGISAVISPMGKIDITSQFSPAGVVRDVDWNTFRTFYARVGDVFAVSCLMLTAVGLLIAIFRSLR